MTEEKEIDLTKITKAIRVFFIDFFSLLLRNIKLLISFSLAGLAIAIIYVMMQKPVYQSSVVMNSKYLENTYCNELISQLNGLIREENYAEASFLLKMDQETMKKLSSIEFNNFIDSEKEEPDSIVNNRPFRIRANVYDTGILDTLQASLINYFKNTPYARKRERVAMNNLRDRIEKINQEMASIDTLKTNAIRSIQPRGNSTGFIFGQPYEPLNVYKEVIALFLQQMDLRSQAELNESIEVIQPFVKYNKPVAPRPVFTSAMGILIGGLFGFFIVIFIESRKLILTSVRKRRQETASV